MIWHKHYPELALRSARSWRQRWKLKEDLLLKHGVCANRFLTAFMFTSTLNGPEPSRVTAQGKASKGMFVSIQNAERDINLKSKKLVNALLPIEAAYDSDDEDLEGGGGTRVVQPETLAGSEPAAPLTVADLGQDDALPMLPPPPQSPPPPLPADEVPPVLPAEAPAPDTLQGQRQPAVPSTPAVSNAPAGRRERSPVPRKLSSAGRKHTRSDHKRRGGSPRRRSRSRSRSISPPRQRRHSSAGHGGGSHARSRSRSPKQPRQSRNRSRSRARRGRSATPPASSRRRNGAANEERHDSKGRRDRRGGSHEGRGRSPKRQNPTETRQSDSSRGQRLEKLLGQPKSPSRPSSPAPSGAEGCAAAPAPAASVCPAASVPVVQLPGLDSALPAEPALAVSSGQIATGAVRSAQPQVRGAPKALGLSKLHVLDPKPGGRDTISG